MTQYFKINPNQLVSYFEDRVRKLCENCKRYNNNNSSCPPFIESIDYYKNLILNYNKAILVVKKFYIDDITKWKELCIESSEKLREELNNQKNILNLKDTLIFGAGSCKYCKECQYPCKFPEYRLISLEGIGLNVVKLVSDISNKNIQLKFPVEKYGYFYRVGMVLWNDKI